MFPVFACAFDLAEAGAMSIIHKLEILVYKVCIIAYSFALRIAGNKAVRS